MKLGRLFIGLLSGLTFGMLFAPKKGKELRKAIMKKSGDPTEVLKVLGEAVMDAGSEAYKEFLKLSEHEQVKALKTLSKEKVDEFVETAKEKGYEIAADMQEKVEKAAEKVTDSFKHHKK